MKDLIKQYLDQGMSRRQLVAGLSALGMSSVAAKAVAQNLSPLVPGAVQTATADAPAAIRDVEGNGGALFVAQLKAAGVEYIFFNPSTGDHPIFDALVDVPEIKLIKGIQEGAVVAMADGYARASGRTGVVVVANIGLPNAMTQMVNSWKDQIPLLVAVASVDQDALGRDQFQEAEHPELMTQPITKWFWQMQSTAAVTETTRRALKFASTPPCGPVFLSLPTNTLEQRAKSQVWDRSKFDVPMHIRPDKDDIDKAARMLIEANNPLISIGDEITWCRADKELLELAELIGAPVAGEQNSLGYWSKPFPTRHPLFIGTLLRTMQYPGKPDVLLNLGNRFGEMAAPGTKLISIRLDPTSLARSAPVDLAMVADLRLAIAGLTAAIRGMATAARLKDIADARAARAAAYSSQMRDERKAIARGLADSTPVSLERLGLELEANLDRDTCYVADVDSGKTMDPLMAFGGDDKQYFGTGPNVLGWGMAAAFGVKLARPDVPVVSVVGDGSFCFSGPQPLWSMARYKAPVTVIVLNNHSYNNERNRIWNSAGRQFEAARDMTCYLGDPDVDFAKTASAFGVEGETVKEPDGLKGAFARAKSAMVEGRPLSARHSHQARRLGRGVGMASALLARRPAHPEGVIMRIPLSGLFALAIATASPSFAQNANPLPPGDGRDIVAVACSQCHYLGTIAKIRDGAGGWRVYVNNMVLRGAQLTAPEIDKVVDYLALNLGPGANLPPTRPVTLPDGHGKDLVETRCGLCHDLERVATIKRRKQDWPVIVANMVTWGATATPEEAQTMTDYLATNFGN